MEPNVGFALNITEVTITVACAAILCCHRNLLLTTQGEDGYKRKTSASQISIEEYQAAHSAIDECLK